MSLYLLQSPIGHCKIATVYSIKSRGGHLPDASVFRAGRPRYLPTNSVTTAAQHTITAMPKLLSRLTKWFGLEVVHVIVVRRSRHGDLRFLHSTFPPDHPSEITLTLEEEETKAMKEGTFCYY
ncbi:hypothetical protein N7476_004714 [Penicillium atrosanguineum]|uniref:Uncharacterized protein n=1 Tax=Penicillium atrosanguineum TaxID=1132637 RepID=A0A9W9U4S9_9EURO|nr:hypothetical protein N7476_004714 [Penicillium atrosanguineum]